MDFEDASMYDHSVYGEILYELKFSEAIKRDLISDDQIDSPLLSDLKKAYCKYLYYSICLYLKLIFFDVKSISF